MMNLSVLEIHTLKGLSGNVGASGLFEILRNVEIKEDKYLMDILYKRY